MTYSVVLVSNPAPHVLAVGLNRPESLNALNREMLLCLGDILDKLSGDKETRAVVFYGAGDKAFCAGADLKERKDMPLSEVPKFVKLIGQSMEKIAQLPMPSIAAINGVAFGGGLELALACDMRVMQSDTKIGLTECSLGIIPGAGGTQRLARIVGLSKAKELIFGALRIGAQEAFSCGLINYISTEKSAFSDAVELAKKVAANAPLSVRAAKKAIDEGWDLPLNEGLRLENKCYQSILHTQDRLEALKAFAEKRAPQFKGS